MTCCNDVLIDQFASPIILKADARDPPRDVTVSTAASANLAETNAENTFLRAQSSDHGRRSDLFYSEFKQRGDSGVDLALDLERGLSSADSAQGIMIHGGDGAKRVTEPLQ